MYNYNLTQRPSTPAFTADIRRNPFMQAGIKRSLELLKDGTEESLYTVNRIVNNLSYIRADKNIKTVDIDAYPEDVFHILFPGLHTVKIDGKKEGRYMIENTDSKNFGDYFIEAVNNFIERHYGSNVSQKLESELVTPLETMKKSEKDSLKRQIAEYKARRMLSSMIKTINIQAKE
ncbi:hypothetical protein IJ541_09455 [bacterium]|nr:hypothetical protein [bacterium]